MKMLKYITVSFILLMFTGCESFVDPGAPRNETISSTVYSDDAAAVAAVRGIYHEMVRIGFASGTQASITLLGGLSGDEFISYQGSMDEFYANSIVTTSSLNLTLWSSAYKTIYYCNSAIEGLQSSTTLTSAVKNQLIAEAKFLRAFSYCYLTSFYGEVPIVLTTDYRVNARMTRSAKSEVYKQVLQDLSDAEALLPRDYIFTASERVRATAWAAKALMARVYLYTGEWSKSEQYCTDIISSALFRLPTDLNTVFLKNSTETIWQLMPVVSGQNTNEGMSLTPTSTTSVPPFVAIRPSVVTSIESGDRRRTSWVASQVVNGTTIYYPVKYKVFRTGQAVTEYSMVLRLAELYLIRAEARVRQSKFTDAMDDVDIIRTRAGIASIRTRIATPTIDNVMSAIEQERKVEFLSEWSHRWIDLQRWDRATAVLQPLKPGWQASAILYPVPQSDINSNPNLNPQNPGY